MGNRQRKRKPVKKNDNYDKVKREIHREAEKYKREKRKRKTRKPHEED
jgi:hypothetical protein